MTSSWITIFVPLFAVWVCVWGQDCSVQRLEGCKGLLGERFRVDSYLLAVTRGELDDVCRRLDDGVICVENFLKECAKDQKHDVLIITKLMSGLRAFEDEMCRVDSPLATEYLRHAPCLDRSASNVKHCKEKFKSFQKDPNLSDGKRQRDALKTPCCNATFMIGCVLDGYERECGAESVPSARRTMEIIIHPVEEVVCATVDKSQCPSNGGSFGVVSSRVVALVSSAVTLWLWWCRH